MTSLFSSPLTFIDIETTGLSPIRDRIIEVAAIRVENGKVVETFEQLINPEVLLPTDITLLTGITNDQIKHAPRFFDIKDELKRLTKDSLFIAHNARFDYGFMKHEFKRYDESFSPKQLCTVKLFRALVPHLPHYNLDSLLTYFGIETEYRHRALSDAKALWEFIQRASQSFSEKTIAQALAVAMKRQALPTHLLERDIEALPQAPGVYLMYGDDPSPLYVGKSITIRDRVLSHFSESINSSKEMKLAHQVRRIETIETSGELSALLLESALVKKYQPLYNRQLRKLHKMLIAQEVQKEGEFLKVNLTSVDYIDPDMLPTIVSVFKSQKQAKNQLLEIAKEHTLCPKLLGLETGKGGCFWERLGWCKGACVGKEKVASYNLRFVTAFSKLKYKRWPFEGPIVIKEETEDRHGGIVVDKWCVLGTIENERELPTPTPEAYVFELDTYKILVRHLFSTKHTPNIQPYPHLTSKKHMSTYFQ